MRGCWNEHGREALERVARDQPEVLIKVVASLLPKTIDLNLAVDAGSFAATFETALAMLGNAPVQRRRPAPPNQPSPPLVIDHDD